MGSAKFVGMDVHKEAISSVVMNSAVKLTMESIIESKAITPMLHCRVAVERPRMRARARSRKDRRQLS